MDSKDEHIALESSGGVSMDEHETVYSKLSFFKKSRWKGLLAIVVATGLIFEFATFGLSVHCELKPKTEHYLDFLTRSNEAGTEAPKINLKVRSEEISNHIPPYGGVELRGVSNHILPYIPPSQPYRSLCKYQAQYRLSQTSNKIVTICSLSGDEIRVDLRVFLQHKPTRIGIYLSPAEFYSLARLYDTILDDLNTQIFMLENESVVGGGLNLTSL
jgi:hypothetical protein